MTFVSRPVLDAAAWRKSSYSNTQGGDCVEVADNVPGGVVPVRDSTRPGGPVVVFSDDAWVAFVDALGAS
ncbi:DUF397 domain-containing protein [Streptomyces sp. NPDC000151]|uniref:DUF397 domain-containing protein n=1 Tax=Streptomyces sp. NPDC000151 TaxID=3154244 RepID=UPI00332BFC51